MQEFTQVQKPPRNLPSYGFRLQEQGCFPFTCCDPPAPPGTNPQISNKSQKGVLKTVPLNVRPNYYDLLRLVHSIDATFEHIPSMIEKLVMSQQCQVYPGKESDRMLFDQAFSCSVQYLKTCGEARPEGYVPPSATQ
eukprot:1608431-Amphidinium_carterae.1